ncbi:ralBP1-associated Eps domain-containing protein 2-like isoform X2 [Artemia franciscana]|uniref:ralBP1-associated Eps domain-containing protein 2-like isoform X2 n=1 Tax=Artemia franciscana TaxID=6661 RepID=UPI0032DA1F72
MQNAVPQLRQLPFPNCYPNSPEDETWFDEENALKATTDLIQLSDTNEVGEESHADDSSSQGKRSPSVSSANSESPTPTNSREAQGWNQSRDHWEISLMSDEHRQLLGTEEESSDRHSEPSRSGSSASSSNNSGTASSSPAEEEEIESVYAIRPDQRAYYIERFKHLISDGSQLLPGLKAKEFFAKSKLPVSELSKIWELSDVTRDGALSLEEFLVAMHLVVLRRNNIPVPEILPPCLTIPVHNSGITLSERISSEVLIPDLEPVPINLEPKYREPLVKSQWTKFVESPTTESISSPGPKPVNFDFQKIAIEQDPRIVHPIPRRLTPEMQLENSSKQLRQEFRQPSASFACGDESQGPTSLPFSNRKDPPPPPPPPRPTKGHARSASLDLNSLGAPTRASAAHAAPLKPIIPPRVSPSLTPRRIKQTSLDVNGENSQSSAIVSSSDMVQNEVVRPGAFEVYRKTEVIENIPFANEALSSHPLKVNNPRTKRSSLAAIIEQHQTRSEALRRQHKELLSDLATLMEEKSILEVRLNKQNNG